MDHYILYVIHFIIYTTYYITYIGQNLYEFIGSSFGL